MEKKQLKEEILSVISNELDIWLEKSGQIKSGYEYEESFMFHMRRINKMILEKSVGTVPKNKNLKKNFIHV
jgi:hypothetical protein